MPTVERGASQGRGQGHPPSLACCVLAFNVRCALTTPTPLLLFVLKSEVFAIGYWAYLEFRISLGVYVHHLHCFLAF
jgi:hypothetical protein